jgi:hypothetical protein
MEERRREESERHGGSFMAADAAEGSRGLGCSAGTHDKARKTDQRKETHWLKVSLPVRQTVTRYEAENFQASDQESATNHS